MKKLSLLLVVIIILLCNCSMLFGQSSDTSTKKNNYNYVSFCALTGTSFLFSNNKNGALSIKFPYTITDAAGVRSDSIFSSSAIQPYHKLKAFISPLYLEVGNLKSFYTAQFLVSIIGAAAGYNYTLGYGRNFYFNNHFYTAKKITENSFVIKPFMRISYTGYRGYGSESPFYFGNIDNENRYIDVLGSVALPTYTSGDRYPHTYNAKTLDVIYTQNEWAIIPGISITSNPYRHYFYWEIEMGYNAVLHEKGSVVLEQNISNKIKMVSLNDSKIKVTYNNTTIQSTPYLINGFYAGIKAGVSIRSKSLHDHPIN